MQDFSKLDRLLQHFSDTSLPGCTCAVMQDGKWIYSGWSGFADREKGIPAGRETIYRQASMTKLFTYTILGMLYEEGAFLLSDPIGDYLPEWKQSCRWERTEAGEIRTVPTRPITIRDAITMSCGLPYCMGPNADANDPTRCAMSERIAALLQKGTPTLRDEVRVMADVPLGFAPGSRWLYGFGSEISGVLVETMTGKPLREVFDERLIRPLGLAHTGTWITPENRSHVAVLYTKDAAGRLVPAGPEADRVMDPACTPVGARPHLLTTSEDYAQFMYMLANGGEYRGKRLIGHKTIDLLRTNQLTARQLEDFTNTYLAGYGYGLGFRTLLDRAPGGHNGSLGAFGWTGGAGTWAEADPAEHLGAVYMHNMLPNEEVYHHLRVRAAIYGAL